MKKRGLIVATIVMVLVLAVSLTTATYAWFTNEGSAQVTDIGFSVSAASDLVIGVKANNTFKKASEGAVSWSDFYSDGTEYDPDTNKWTGATQGLGLSVNTELDLRGITQAVYSFTTTSITRNPAEHDTAPNAITGATATDYEKGTGQTVTKGFDMTQTALKASGNGETITGGYADAIKNVDYLDVVFGVAAANNEVLTFGCLVSIDNDETLAALGMNAAIHVLYSTDGINYTELDVYGSKTAGDANSSVPKPNAPTVTIPAVTGDETNYPAKTLTYTSKYTDSNDTVDVYSTGDANVWIPLRNATNANDYATTGAAGIVQLHLIIYICGPDGDCTTAATGTGATISIEFINTNKSNYAAA